MLETLTAKMRFFRLKTKNQKEEEIT